MLFLFWHVYCNNKKSQKQHAKRKLSPNTRYSRVDLTKHQPPNDDLGHLNTAASPATSSPTPNTNQHHGCIPDNLGGPTSTSTSTTAHQHQRPPPPPPPPQHKKHSHQHSQTPAPHRKHSRQKRGELARQPFLGQGSEGSTRRRLRGNTSRRLSRHRARKKHMKRPVATKKLPAPRDYLASARISAANYLSHNRAGTATGKENFRSKRSAQPPFHHSVPPRPAPARPVVRSSRSVVIPLRPAETNIDRPAPPKTNIYRPVPP